ncbi:MAG TPA: bifunctional diguanylate cyclase/phosphodiesterase, partial [Steroidobacteraceae bacterium]|nr:bifunctional diguanylate cyclase/phosphodiesterase [Steroidobacteraceae bacterium]
MAALIKKRDLGWVPTVVVLAVVLIAGSRLMYLSVQHHAAAARAAASTVAAGYVSKIEPDFQKLGNFASRQAAAAAKALADTSTFTSLESVPLARNTFWMTAEDRVLASRPTEAASASGIASEWESAEVARPVPGSSVLGPMRLGSQWLVSARVPVVPAIVGVQPASRGWAVSYSDLEDVISSAHLARLTDAGYDFELSQVEPRSSRSRIFVTSSTDPLVDAVITRIRLPTGFAPAIPGSYLAVSIRPRNGWYPATELASDIGLLAFLAWLLAFGTHDLSHALQRSRAALAAARRRLRTINQQLATEMQQRLSLQETFDHARFHDAFTGLPNRRYFMDQLDRALRDVRTKRRQRVAVIIVDISRFKLVNDMLGHTAGDELMVQAARRFEKSTSAFEGVLARWGGDQFAVLILDVTSTEMALQVAGLLQDELRTPFELRRHKLVVTATIGVTSVDSGQQRAEDVVREADIALTVAKRQETSKIVVYSPNMAGQAATLVSLEADLHVALEKHELRLLFQPVVDLRTYRMVGAEALLRWRHPVESVLAPDKFLRIAEEAGLMVPITRWIILRVVKLAGEWLRRLPANQKFFISINLSPTALRDPGLAEYIAALLRETQLPPSLLKFELTEAALISNVGAARETLERLHAMGIQLMLDDFGTGYSSLSYLQLFPFDFVKIDRPFVNSSGSDQANTGMMAALVQMAGSLNLTAIAEIIETEAAAKALQEMGCDYGQGYYFSEPIEAELALQRLRTQHPFQPPQATGTFAPQKEKEKEKERETTGDETVMVPPLEVDDSPTIMIPATSIG